MKPTQLTTVINRSKAVIKAATVSACTQGTHPSVSQQSPQAVHAYWHHVKLPWST
jgi:hypothetical protein